MGKTPAAQRLKQILLLMLRNALRDPAQAQVELVLSLMPIGVICMRLQGTRIVIQAMHGTQHSVLIQSNVPRTVAWMELTTLAILASERFLVV